MDAIRIQGRGVIYRGREASSHFRNAAFPSIVEMPEGELVATLNIGRERNSPDTRSYCCRSLDGGETWGSPEKIYEPEEKAFPASTQIRMSKTPDGDLIGFLNIYDRANPDSPLTNPLTGGTVEREHGLTRSRDGGKTWSKPRLFPFPLAWKCFGEPSPVLALSKRRWLLPSLTRLNWEGKCPFGLKSFVLISEDGGKTWPRAVDVFDLWKEKQVTWEQKLTQLTDGRLFAATWVYDTARKKNLPNHYSFSEDAGDSWHSPLLSPLKGQTCTPLALADNHLLFIYRRWDGNGLWAHLAKVNGLLLEPLAEACFWGSKRTILAGCSDSSIQNQHALQFGYPQLIELAGGDVFVVFWAVEKGLSVIRWVRLMLG